MSNQWVPPASSAEPAPPTVFRPTLRQILSRSFWAGADWGRVARPSRLDEVSKAADDFADRELPKIERLPVALSPVQEEATPTLDAEKIDGLIRGVLWAMDLVERGPAFNGSRYDVDRSRLTAARNGLVDIRRSLASALPALLEASHFENKYHTQICDALRVMDDLIPFDERAKSMTLTQRIEYIKSLLSGSISELAKKRS